MSIALVFPNFTKKKVTEIEKRFRSFNEKMDIQVWPKINRPNDVEFVVTWLPDHGYLKTLPNLKVVANFGAGVDHICEDKSLPESVKITRVVDEDLATDIAEYVTMTVFAHKRKFKELIMRQLSSYWEVIGYKRRLTVGVLGLGNLGLTTVRMLQGINVDVIGWRKKDKPIDGVDVHSGEEGLTCLLSKSDVVVGLLPLTNNTENIYNQSFFDRMRKQSYFINAGRGRQLVEGDLLNALNSNHLSGACLDVFRKEPLPENHPFWSRPEITITPHNASLSNPETVVKQIYENYLRLCSGEEINFVVDRSIGY